MQQRLFLVYILMAGLTEAATECGTVNAVEIGGFGKSNVPIYGRGFGPPRQWMVGIRDRVEGFGGKLRLDFGGRVWGGAFYDNPDALEGGFGIYYNHRSKFRVGLDNWNLFSMNNHPAVDPSSRRKTSAINRTALRIDRDLQFKGGCLVVAMSTVLRGNLPVWHPTAITKPYANRMYELNYRRKLGKWLTEPKVTAYKAEGLRGRFEVMPVLLRAVTLWDHNFYVLFEPTFNVNVGVPKTAQKTSDTRGFVLGVRVPIR